MSTFIEKINYTKVTCRYKNGRFVFKNVILIAKNSVDLRKRTITIPKKDWLRIGAFGNTVKF